MPGSQLREHLSCGPGIACVCLSQSLADRHEVLHLAEAVNHRLIASCILNHNLGAAVDGEYQGLPVSLTLPMREL